jgi:outer membrane lipoprotein-sorting protein
MSPRFASFLLPLLLPLPVHGQDAREIVRKAETLMRGTHTFAEISMTVVKPTWSRSVTMKVWSLEPDYALVYVTAPARDKGAVTLKRKSEVWNWLPSIQRVIKIPPSMMLQSWMGSDFTNDDLVRQSSILTDYTHKLLGIEESGGVSCWKIEMVPLPQAPVVWGKLIVWISQGGYIEMQTNFYDEDGNLARSFTGSDIKTFDDRQLPAHWEMIPFNTPGNKTVLEYRQLTFRVQLDQDFFSERNMKQVR